MVTRLISFSSSVVTLSSGVKGKNRLESSSTYKLRTNVANAVIVEDFLAFFVVFFLGERFFFFTAGCWYARFNYSYHGALRGPNLAVGHDVFLSPQLHYLFTMDMEVLCLLGQQAKRILNGSKDLF